MRRRDFIKGIAGSAAVRPFAARAQQPMTGVRRIAVLMAFDEDSREAQSRLVTFREALDKLGWKEGRNLTFEYRWTGNEDMNLMREGAKELVALHPDLILMVYHGKCPLGSDLLRQ
jgi:putative tryptophan/tyrosine transport system substrate-binding protein